MLKNTTLLALLATALSMPLGAQELLDGGALDEKGRWYHWPSNAEAAHVTDDGASKKGCLYVADDGAGEEGLKMWRGSVTFEAGAHARLRLSCSVKAAGLEPGTRINLMGQVVAGEEMVAFPRTLWVIEDCDWTDTEVVFDVDPGATRLNLLFFINGVGKAWLDDVSVTPSDADVTQPQRAPAPLVRDSKMEALVRGAAGEIPWLLDGAAALEAARERKRPVLIYVRCADPADALPELQGSLEAGAVPFLEDGMQKDLLFRAGPLSTPRIAEFISEEFIPACMSYTLSAHNRTDAGEMPTAWLTQANKEGDTSSFDRAEGAADAGSLRIERSVKKQLRSWMQRFDWSGEAATLELAASMKAAQLSSGGEANVMVQCWKGDKALAYGRLAPIKRDADWTERTATFDVPEGTEAINVVAYLSGSGVAHFDDIAVRREKGEENFLKNGALTSAGSSDFGGLPLVASRVTTPALMVVAADGRRVATLDRIGALSDDLVARWLERALKAARTDGKSPKVKKPHAKIRGARAMAAKGEWGRALDATARVQRAVGEEAQFLHALCLQRLGRHAEAKEEWKAMASTSAWGRKAAACVLDEGPRLHEAMSLRDFPKLDGLDTTTENLGRRFDAQDSIVSLLEFQREDGSFGGHRGKLGMGWNDPAITALAIDALRIWEPRANRKLRPRMTEAVSRARGFLRTYVENDRRAPTRSAGFINPYTLHTLLREGDSVTAQKLVEHIQAGQDADGNWSVYGDHRPASFNTAQNVHALIAAREAGLLVDGGAIESGLAALGEMRSKDDLFPYSTGPGHEWMTTLHGSIGRDALCEHVLLVGGVGSKERLDAALGRYMRHAHELRAPTKRLYDYFNSRGHGGYFFFFSHHRALEAAQAYASPAVVKRVKAFVREQVLLAQEGDGTFMDHYSSGRAYGTAQALVLLGLTGD